jgi:tetratricopeptide (TPR) repeat protein
MRFVLFIIIVVTSYHYGFSQQNEIDSLENSFKTIKVDSVKLKILKKIVNFYSNSNKSKHVKYVKEAISLSQKLDNNSEAGFFIKELGYYYRRDSKLDSSFIAYKKAQSFFLKAKDSSKYYYTYYDLGNLRKNEGKYDEAFKYFYKGISYFERQKDNIRA